MVESIIGDALYKEQLATLQRKVNEAQEENARLVAAAAAPAAGPPGGVPPKDRGGGELLRRAPGAFSFPF